MTGETNREALKRYFAAKRFHKEPIRRLNEDRRIATRFGTSKTCIRLSECESDPSLKAVSFRARSRQAIYTARYDGHVVVVAQIR
jgi:hypothetical protein